MRACVHACVCVHGMYTRPIVKKTPQEYRRWEEREGPDSKTVSRIIDQAALTLLPKGFAEIVPWNCDYFTHTSEQSVSRVLRFQRKTPSVQTSFTQENDAKHCHIQTKKKINAMCVLDINMALSLNRTSRSMKREKKSPFAQAAVLEILKLWTYGVCNTSRMVLWATRSTTLTSGNPYHKDEERTKLMTTQSPRCTRHQCASRAPSGSIFSSWRKYCPKTTITFMMHCLMETGYWTQEPRQFWFQGRHPWASKEHAQQSKE